MTEYNNNYKGSLFQVKAFQGFLMDLNKETNTFERVYCTCFKMHRTDKDGNNIYKMFVENKDFTARVLWLYQKKTKKGAVKWSGYLMEGDKKRWITIGYSGAVDKEGNKIKYLFIDSAEVAEPDYSDVPF